MKRKSLLFLLLFGLLAPWAANAQTDLTVCNGTATSSYVPIYGYWADAPQHNQMIYPATDLTAMNGMNITKMVFYLNSGTTGSDIGNWTISLGETTATTLSGHDNTTALTQVYSGPMVFDTQNSTMTITFTGDYTYQGGNLLVDFTHTSGGYRSMSFFGISATSASLYQYSSYSANVQNFLPKNTFTYDIPPTCPKPTNLACINTTTATAELTWNPGGSETNWVLQYDTDINFTAPTQVNLTSYPYTLTNLTPCTTYYARVKADCRDESEWTDPVSFTTKQEPVAVGQGWSDDFESTGNWFMFNGGNNAWVVGSAVNNGGSQSLYISNDGGATNAYTTSGINMVYATKLMTFATAQYIVDYDWQAYGEGSYDYIRAWLAPSTATFTANQLPDGTTSSYNYQTTTPQGWISLDGGGKLNGVSAWQSQSETVDITAGDYYVVFMWANDGSGGGQPPAAIDNFEITKVACAAPSAFAASNVMGHKATLSWISDGSAWQVAYADTDTIPADNLTPIAVLDTTYQLTGLTPEKRYYAYVRTDCGGTYSAWTSTTFTTTVACPAPTGFACTALTATTATLSWTETGEATNWVVEYGTTADFTGATSVNVSTTPSVNLTGLTAETVYYARVKADCGSGDESTWVSTSFEPTAKTVIGTAATTNSYVPTYVLYNYSLTQQIYTPAELGAANAILSIDFYCNNNGTKTRDFDIYMVSTNKSTFTSTTDWIPVTAADLVFSTTGYTWHQGWNSFELDNPFSYDGTSNVAIIFDDNAGQWESSYSFAAFPADSLAIRVYGDDTNYNPTSPSSYTGTVMNVKNHIRLLMGTPNPCAKPTALAANTVFGHSAVLSWTSEATAWQICVNNDETNLIDVTTNPYTLGNLTPETTYTVKMRANCGEGSFSDWTAAISFTTDVDCAAPANLTIDAAAESADLAWVSESENFEIWYREMVYDPNNDFENSAMQGWTTIDADGDGYTWVLGSQCGGIYLVSGASLAGSGHESSQDFITSGSYTNVTQTALTPDNYLVSPQVELGGRISFWACAQDAGYPEEHFGVAVSTTSSTDPTAFSTIQEWTLTAKGTGAMAKPGTTRSGNRDQSAWNEYTVDLSEYSGYGYVAIRHFSCTDKFMLNVDDIIVDQPSGTTPAPAWTEATSATNSYTITGLTPEIEYEVQVRAICGDNEYSEWTHDTFWTTPLCPAPEVTLEDYGTDYITLSWVSEAAAFDIALDGEPIEEAYEGNSYTFENLDPGTEYHVAVRAKCGDNGDSQWVGGYVTTECEAFDLPYEYGFETNDIICWSKLQSNSENSGSFGIINMTSAGLEAYEGDYAFMFSSYNEADYYDQLLISPELNTEAAVKVEFYYKPYTTNYGNESFVVGYSTTTNDYSAFIFDEEEIVEADNPEEWTLFSKTFPAGTKYVAVYYLSEYIAYLFVDNFSFTEEAGGIALTEGINWFSTYIEVDDPIVALDMLKEALGENATIIESMDETTEYDGEWFGELDDIGITNEQMYLITVTTDCTVNLQGDPADPADHSITINPGWNWIGFPCDHELNIADALIDFEAEMEDVLEGRDGYTEFDGEWFGDIETLVPGQGYLYYYHGDTPTRLVFHAESKAKRSTPNNINIKQIGQKRHLLGQKQNNKVVSQINNQIKK